MRGARSPEVDDSLEVNPTRTCTVALDGTSEASAPTSTLVPDAVIAARYRIREWVGRGGMGIVWKAEDLVERRVVAIKEVATHSRGETAQLLFQREFFAMKKLEHPGTIKVYDYGLLPSGNHYIAMEFVEGEDMRTRVRRTPLDSKEAAAVLTQLAQTLAFIHARLFIHCDIKAENVRIVDGRTKLMDFGLMHQLGMTQAGPLRGTPAYVAPERIRGGTVDGRADLYSLGALGFFAVTGELPFRAPTVHELLEAHCSQTPPAPSSLVPIEPALERILLRLLAKDPGDRFPSAGALLSALEELVGVRSLEEQMSGHAAYLQVPVVVGRERELETLSHALNAAARGASRPLFVGAPAGTGKSRLIAELELRAKLADVPFGVGVCRAEGLAPLGPIAHALRVLVALTPAHVLEGKAAALRALLPASDRSDDSPMPRPAAADSKLARFEALSAWVRSVAETRTFVLCFEDLHWADHATIEHLNVLLRALEGTRGLVLGTFRSDEVEKTSTIFRTLEEGVTDYVELAPLSLDGVRALATAALPGFALPDSWVRELHGVTKGNAFFAMECLRMRIEQRALRRASGHWVADRDLLTKPLPSSIAETVAERLQTLSPARKALLERLAPAGRILDMPLVRAVADLEEEDLFAALDEAMERQFLQYSDGQYVFLHDTVHRSIYEQAPESARKEHHRRIAEHLARVSAGAPEAARSVGYHYARSDEPSRAIEPLLEAARHLLSSNAMFDAYLVLREAAALLERTPDRASLLPATWARLVEVGYSSDTPASARYASALFSYWSKKVDVEAGRRAVAAELEAAAGAPAGERTERRRTLFRDVTIRSGMTEAEVFLKRSELRILQSIALAITRNTEAFRAVLSEADVEHLPGAPFRAAAHIAEGGLSAHTGEFEGVIDRLAGHVHELRQFLDEVPDAPKRIAWALAMGGYFLNINLALMGLPLDPKATEDGFRIADELGVIDLRIYHTFARLVRASLIGDAREFDPREGEMTDFMRRLGNPPLPERNIAVYGPPYYLERGELDELANLVKKGRHISETLLPGDGWLKLYVEVYGACLDASRGDAERAAKSLPQAIARARESQLRMETLVLVYQSRFATRLGQHALARQAAERALERALDTRLANPFDEIIARRALAATTDDDAARRSLERAREIATTTGNVLQSGIVAYTIAKRPRTTAAERSACLDEAERTFHAARAGVWEAKVRRARAVHGASNNCEAQRVPRAWGVGGAAPDGEARDD